MAITDLDEQLLVRAHQAGDEHAFGQIVRSQHRALYAHAYSRLGSHEAAEDAVQDTLLRAYRALPSFDGDLRLRAWLHRILTNVCHDESNRRRRQIGLIDKLESLPVELAPDPIEEAVLHDTVRVMNEALAELPESYREALVLRYVDGLSFREVADVAGISEENARARVHRGRLALHKVLSRMAVMLAFLIPGMRRSGKALDTGAELASAGGTDHAVSISTQLATHMATAAPMINRVAAEGSTFMAAKSSVVATAVAAVAAVSAPVVAYRVYDTATAPERPPAATALPADDGETEVAGSSTTFEPSKATEHAADAADDAVDGSTTTLLPPSAATPFADAFDEDDEADDESNGVGRADDETDGSPTTTPPTDEPAEPAEVIGSLGGDDFTVTGERPDFDLSGTATLESETADDVTGTLAGALYIADLVGEEATAEMQLTLPDGTVHRVRFRGVVVGEEPRGGDTFWTLRGSYRIPGGAELGLAETGGATVVFQLDDDGLSELSFTLEGTAEQ